MPYAGTMALSRLLAAITAGREARKRIFRHSRRWEAVLSLSLVNWCVRRFWGNLAGITGHSCRAALRCKDFRMLRERRSSALSGKICAARKHKGHSAFHVLAPIRCENCAKTRLKNMP